MGAESFRVHEDRVVFAAEPALGQSAGAVVPDDLVEKVFLAEDRVKLDADIMGDVMVEVDVERALLREQAVALLKAGHHEGEIGLRPALQGIAVAVPIFGRCPSALGAERWIDVDQVAGAIREIGHVGEVVAAVEDIGRGWLDASAGSPLWGNGR